jgi:hypothetical protein
MGLKDKLEQNGSNLSAYNGNTPTVNPLATNQSQLHASANGSPGYSLYGFDATTVNNQYQQYLDGTPNSLPLPSFLDMNGMNSTPYLNNPPH